MQHVPVLLREVLDGLALRPGACVIDATLGGGGHTAAILERSAPDGHVLGLDADPAALDRVRNQLNAAIETGRLTLVQTPFDQMARVAHQHAITAVHAILLDLGLSSFQLESPARGFSFLRNGPLDMRFDPAQPISAADIVNTWSEQELADIIYHHGEERQSRRIARRIVQARPLYTTHELAAVVADAVGSARRGRRPGRIHPATRTFQALRIAVNHELAQVERTLPQCLDLLQPGGRLAVISFHSLEDRIVKQWMQQEARTYVPDATHPHGGYERNARLQLITRKPITPTPREVEQNPRSRSAKLRIAEKTALAA